MKLKVFLFLMLAAVTASSYAQEGGIRGKVVSRNGRAALSDVEVTIESLGLTARTNRDGEFLFENLPAGDYTVQFSTPEFEDLEVMVRERRVRPRPQVGGDRADGHVLHRGRSGLRRVGR